MRNLLRGKHVAIAGVPPHHHVSALVSGHILHRRDPTLGSSPVSVAGLDTLGVNIVQGGIAGVSPRDDGTANAIAGDERASRTAGHTHRHSVRGPLYCPRAAQPL